MSNKFNVPVEEALWVVSTYQTAAEEEDYKFRILGVGGSEPLVFANHYLAPYPYHMRASKGRQPIEAGKGAERFSVSTWSIHDLHKFPWVFSDKEFDLIWCEPNILDTHPEPVKVLKELSRIGRCGYIRCTHRNFESSYNVESAAYVGYAEHLWFIEPEGHGLKFVEKNSALPIELVPEYTGEREIGVWWTGSIHGIMIKLEDVAWEADMRTHIISTKKLKYPHDYKEMI